MNNYSLRYLLNIALKYWVAIVLAAVIAAGAAFTYFNYMVSPKYTAKGSVIVTNGRIISNEEEKTNTSAKVDNSDIVASINFVDTMVDILKTPGIYKQLAEELGDDYTSGQLMGGTAVTRRNENTIFIDVSFTASDPKEAINVINAYLELAPDYISSMVKNSAASVVPAESSYWGYPSDFKVIATAGILGAAIMYVIIFLIYSSSNVIRDGEDFEDISGLTVIGVVPDFVSSKTREKKYGGYYGLGGKKNG